MSDRNLCLLLLLLSIAVLSINFFAIRLLEQDSSLQGSESRMNAHPRLNNISSRTARQRGLQRTRIPRSRLLPLNNFTILRNYVPALRGVNQNEPLITLATHGDFRYLDNLIEIAKRWQAPISVAIFAPGDDFNSTWERILYLRNCTTSLIKEWVTFHLVLLSGCSNKQTMEPHDLKIANICATPLSFGNTLNTSRAKLNLFYPVNTLRNVARTESSTHYVMVSDIELIPSPGLSPMFFEMLRRKRSFLRKWKSSYVFVVPIFEVGFGESIPNTKLELTKLVIKRRARFFHMNTCETCQTFPGFVSWLKAGLQSKKLNIFNNVKRHNLSMAKWEPIYIGTKQEPLYDENLAWEGYRDKIMQVYKMCLLDYDFMILDNVYLVHKPGFSLKRLNLSPKNTVIRTQNLRLIEIRKASQRKYGNNNKCVFKISTGSFNYKPLVPRPSNRANRFFREISKLRLSKPYVTGM